MVEYIPVKIHLNDAQKKKIKKAIENKESVSIKLAGGQLGKGKIDLALTKAQVKKIQKSVNSGTGMVLSLSRAQLKKNMSGGFLGFLAPLLTSIAGPLLGSLLNPIASSAGNRLGSMIQGRGTKKSSGSKVTKKPTKSAKGLTQMGVNRGGMVLTGNPQLQNFNKIDYAKIFEQMHK